MQDQFKAQGLVNSLIDCNNEPPAKGFIKYDDMLLVYIEKYL